MNNPFQSDHTSRVPHKLWQYGDVYFPTAPNIYSGGHARSSREVKAGMRCSIGAGLRGLDPRQPPTHEACLLSAVGDLK